MILKAGDLDRRIIIESETIIRDEWGDEISTWATLATVWAKIQFNTGAEVTEADQQVSLNRIFFTVRYRTDITARMRINYDSQYYTIKYISQLGRQVGTILHCELRDHE